MTAQHGQRTYPVPGQMMPGMMPGQIPGHIPGQYGQPLGIGAGHMVSMHL